MKSGPKINKAQAKQIGMIILGVLGVVFLIAFGKRILGVIDSILVALGLKKSDDTKRGDAVQAAYGPSSPWHPEYYHSRTGTLLTAAKASELAKQIWDAFGFFNDAEEEINAAIYSCRSRLQVSFLSEKFRQLYKAELLPYLRGNSLLGMHRLNDQELRPILDYVDNLKDT